MMTPPGSTVPRALAAAFALSLVGCGAAEDPIAADEVPEADAVTVDTSDPAARAQYDANVSLVARGPTTAPQTVVAQATVTLPTVGPVDLCARSPEDRAIRR
nr:hypothetical protein [Deltaproteobacteria bacterium]